LIFPRTQAAPFTLFPQTEEANHRQLTQRPIVTGSSVVAVKFRDGVVIAADTLASYGRTLRFKNVQRLHKVNDLCVMGVGGEMSDYSYIQEILEDFTMEDFCEDDGIQLTPAQVHSILCRVLYNKRSKMDPLWNSIIIGGMQDGVPFLGSVGMIGTHYVDDHITTGFGHHLMRPLLREQYRPDLTKDEAVKLVEACLRSGAYRDTATVNKYQIAVCTTQGVTVSKPFALEMKWDYERFIHPTRYNPTAW